MDSTRAIPGFEPEGRSLRYALLAGVSTLLGAFLFVAARSGTHEFPGLASLSGVMFGLCPAAFIGTMVVILIEVFLRGALGLLHMPVALRRRVYQLCVVLPLLAAVGMSINTMRSSQRLEDMLGTAPPASVRRIRVAGFTVFQANRWYSTFTIATNELPPLLDRLGLIASTNLDSIPNLTKDRFSGNALNSGAIPQWNAYARWSQVKSNYDTRSWKWLAVDETGTNVFFTAGFQN